MQLLLFIAFAILAKLTVGHIVPLALTNYGIVIGSYRLSRNNRTFQSNRGIPYAKPPVGNLRFKAPQAPQSWGSRFATNEGPYCIQKNDLFEIPYVEGQEDCLYLNIYVPTGFHPKPLPVLVIIHWGGFFAGRGTSDIIGPEYFMDKDTIVVTFNYRLGIMGFLSTLDDNAPGNFGLKDQSLALKFIKENIRAFGGDPNRITISGQSAGSISVGLHLVSPLSRNLFTQAISQSGSGSNAWLTPVNFLVPTVLGRLSAITGCAGDNAQLVNCLRNIPAAELVATSDLFKYFWTESFLLYWIVTENVTAANPKPFLTKPPQHYYRDGEFMDVPYIIGVAQNEGNLRAEALVRQTQLRNTLNSDFEHLITEMLGLAFSVGPNTQPLYNNIVDFYFGGNPVINISNPNSIQGLINLYTDRLFMYDTFETLRMMSKVVESPIWVYNFNYKGFYSYGNLFGATTQTVPFDWGVSHCDDLLYLYRSPALFNNLPSSDLNMSKKFITLWTDFVIHGNPDHTLHINWNPLHYTSPGEVINFLNITGGSGSVSFQNQEGFNSGRMQFWVDQDVASYFNDV